MTDHLVSDLNEEENGDTCSGVEITAVVSHQFLQSRPHPSNRQMICLFRRVYCIFLLRVFGLAIVECLVVMDDSIKAFFTGQGGVVVVVMTLMISFIISGYMSLSDRCSPDNPSNRGHLIILTLMEVIVWAGITVHLFHIAQYYMMDVIVLNSSLAVFFIFHILFFFNERFSYHMLYGILLASLCIAVPTTTINIINFFENLEWDLLADHRIFTVTTVSICTWLCCIWYSVETHLVVRQCHRYTFHDCVFLVLCFTYYDVWIAMFSCKRSIKRT